MSPRARVVLTLVLFAGIIGLGFLIWAELFNPIVLPFGIR